MGRRCLALMLIVGFPSAGFAAQDAALIAKGQKLYATHKCSTCHSIDGKGNKKGPLDEVGSKLTAEELRQWLTHPDEMSAKVKSTRKPVMKAYDKKMSEEDMDALVAYMQTLKKK